MRTRHWPLFALAELAANGIDDPNWIPFNVPWTHLPPG